MPDASKMMFVRPKNCRYCGNGYYALQHMLEYADSKARWTIIDMAEERADKGPIYTALDQYDPQSFYGFGHGSNTVFTADSETPVFTTNDCGKLMGRDVYLLSCLTANSLGPAIINTGGNSYAGYNISWTWINDSDVNGDPYIDKYAKCFWESANEFWRAYIDGAAFPEAAQAAIDKYNWWIDYWLHTAPEDPKSEDCMMWLIQDRDSLVVMTKEGYTSPSKADIVPNILVAAALIGAAALAYFSFAKPKPRRH